MVFCQEFKDVSLPGSVQLRGEQHCHVLSTDVFHMRVDR